MANPSSSTAHNEPIQDFSHCHDGIVSKLDMLGELPDLLAPAARARDIAEKAVTFFHVAIFEHHQDEERELFPAVLSSADPGEETAHVQAMVRRLTDEHRALEALWQKLESGLRKLAKGQLSDIHVAEVQRLVTQYKAHAAYEEAEFLPLSQTILGRNANHLSALGLSLHMRHTPAKVNATYI